MSTPVLRARPRDLFDAEAYAALASEETRLRVEDSGPARIWVEWPSANGGTIHAVAYADGLTWRTLMAHTRGPLGPLHVRSMLSGRRPSQGRALVWSESGEHAEAVVLAAIAGSVPERLDGFLASALPPFWPALAVPLGDALSQNLAAVHDLRVRTPMEGRLPRRLLDLLARAAAGDIPFQAVGPMMRGGPDGHRLRVLERTHPLAFDVLMASPLALGTLADGLGVDDALAQACPGFTPAHLRRCEGVGLAHFQALVPPMEAPARQDALQVHGARCMRLLARLPPDWTPATPSSWQALATVAAALECSRSLGSENLARSKGDWPGLASRLARVAGASEDDPRTGHHAVCRAASDMHDVEQTFFFQVVLPLVAHASLRLSYPPDETGDGIPVDESFVSARRLLWADKDLPACLETSRLWHARRDAIDRTVVNVDPGLSWPEAFPPYPWKDLEVRAVSDAVSLWEEGALGIGRDGAAGLDHCVYGRLRLIREGLVQVVSVRRALPGGGYARLSTAQIRLGPTPVVEEHRGLRNAPPGAEAEEALAAFLRQAGPALVPTGRPVRAGPRRRSDIEERCGYDWRRPESVTRALEAWSAFLPRWLRGLEALAAYRALASRGYLPDLDAD